MVIFIVNIIVVLNLFFSVLAVFVLFQIKSSGRSQPGARLRLRAVVSQGSEAPLKNNSPPPDEIRPLAFKIVIRKRKINSSCSAYCCFFFSRIN